MFGDSIGQLDLIASDSNVNAASFEQQTPHSSQLWQLQASVPPTELRLVLLPTRSYNSPASNLIGFLNGKRSPSALTPRLGRASPLTPRIGRSFASNLDLSNSNTEHAHAFTDPMSAVQPFSFSNRFVRTALTPRLGRSAPSESV